jgi:hypothetical protein
MDTDSMLYGLEKLYSVNHRLPSSSADYKFCRCQNAQKSSVIAEAARKNAQRH